MTFGGLWDCVPEVVRLLAGQAGQVITLDGVVRCENHDLQVDVILGDMDSIKQRLC